MPLFQVIPFNPLTHIKLENPKTWIPHVIKTLFAHATFNASTGYMPG